MTKERRGVWAHWTGWVPTGTGEKTKLIVHSRDIHILKYTFIVSQHVIAFFFYPLSLPAVAGSFCGASDFPAKPRRLIV